MISDEIQRIINAKAAIKSAIIDKGGTVSEDALIDDYAEAVMEIPSGGGDLPVIHDDDPLTFVCAIDVKGLEQNISIEKEGTPPSKSIEYNKNDTEWLSYVEGTIITMKYGDLVRFRSNDTNGFSSHPTFYRYFKTTGVYYCGGNIMSLMNNTNTLSGKGYCFHYCFRNCKIVTPPVLPATTLGSDCYAYMFSGCSSLVTAPELTATTLTSGCYNGMFYGCSNLVTAPELPAKTMLYGCYQTMFQGCTNLTTAPELPATTMSQNCYKNMFYGCSNLVTSPELPATTLGSECYAYMFRDCTNLTTAPELPATTLESSCYYGMFQGCSSLVTVHELPATTLASSCYYNMFRDCTSLVTAPELPATTLESSCYAYMFNGCKSLKTIKCNARYSSGTTEITTSIGTNWLTNVPNTSDSIFYKNPDWSGPTSRVANTILSNWQIVDWIK